MTELPEEFALYNIPGELADVEKAIQSERREVYDSAYDAVRFELLLQARTLLSHPSDSLPEGESRIPHTEVQSSYPTRHIEGETIPEEERLAHLAEVFGTEEERTTSLGPTTFQGIIDDGSAPEWIPGQK